jgi:hypothetical protein
MCSRVQNGIVEARESKTTDSSEGSMMTIATDVRTGYVLEDMNGPLGYWGPAPVPAYRPSQPFTGTSLRHDIGCVALDRLATTVAGRTWTGTASLMDAAFQQAGDAVRPATLAAA